MSVCGKIVKRKIRKSDVGERIGAGNMQDRNKKTAIGLDIGTTTICGVLTDICTGEMIKKITLANDTFIEGKEDFEKLQDAAKIEEKCLGIIEELSNGADDLACIGVTGQMHGIVYVDREGNGVSPVIHPVIIMGHYPKSGSQAVS